MICPCACRDTRESEGSEYITNARKQDFYNYRLHFDPDQGYLLLADSDKEDDLIIRNFTMVNSQIVLHGVQEMGFEVESVEPAFTYEFYQLKSGEEHHYHRFVCNHCPTHDVCTKLHTYYTARKADAKSRTVLSDSRRSIHLNPQEVSKLNELMTPLILKGQSPSHIFMTCREQLGISKTTFYSYIDKGILDVAFTFEPVFAALCFVMPFFVRFPAASRLFPLP